MTGSTKIRHLWLFQFMADFAAVVAAYYTTYLVRFHSELGIQFFSFVNQALHLRETGDLGEQLEMFYLFKGPRIILILTVTLCVFYALRDLYSDRKFIMKRPVTWNVIVANIFALGLFYAYFYLSRNVFHPRSFFGLLLFLNVIYCVALREAADRLLRFLRSRFGVDKCSAVLVGLNTEAEAIKEYVEAEHPHGIHVVERLDFDPGKPFGELLGAIEESAGKQGVDMIISADKRLSVAQIMQLLELAEELGIPAKILSDKLEVLPNQARMPVGMLHGIPLVHFEAPNGDSRLDSMRKVVSVLTGVVTLLIILPLFGLISLLIRLTSKGPVLFLQERIGVNRRPFKRFKFRTMHDKADELQAAIEEFSESKSPLFKLRNDPRVTAVGRFLRRLSLDELPQLINVVRGEMAIVGPRPLPRRDFDNYYENWHYSRHSGMPGLTCLWQVSGRSDLDFHNMCILDVYYLRNRNWILDLKIILRTFWVVLFGKGAY